MKKILFYTGSKESGGAEHYLSVVLDSISRKKYSPLLGRRLGPVRFVLLLQKERPDLVHFNLGLPIHSALKLILCRFFKHIKVTATVHSVVKQSSRFPFLSPVKKLIALLSLGGVQRFICVSQKSKEMFCNNYNIAPDIVSVVHNGVDIIEANTPDLEKDAFVIGAVNRLVKNKGIDILLKAFEHILKNNQKAILLIAGEGPQKSGLIKYSNDLKIKDKVTFTGHQQNIVDFLSSLDIFVMPSLSESMPFSLMEAMAAGRAVVSTDVGGVRELVTDGINGLLVPPNDPDTLARAISLLIKDEKKRLELGNAARNQIVENFSIASMIRGTEEFFDLVVDEKIDMV